MSFADANSEMVQFAKFSVSQRLELLKPITWLHIPRCGSSFANVLIHHEGICPTIPQNESIEAGDFPLSHFFHKFPKKDFCPGGFSKGDLYPNPPGHLSVGPIFDQIKGHGVIVLRQPEQRILSAFHNDHMGVFVDHKITAREYAEIQQGCMVKMLTYENHENYGKDPHSLSNEGPCMSIDEPSPPTDEDITLASYRLRTGFPFVGLADRFELSVCLFHAMFGGKCQDFMFGDVRTPTKNRQLYDTSELEGFIDHADNALYKVAEQQFEANLRLYGVSETTCPSICQ